MHDSKCKMKHGVLATTPSSVGQIALLGSPMLHQGTSVAMTSHEYGCVREYLGYTRLRDDRRAAEERCKESWARYEDMVQKAETIESMPWTDERRAKAKSFEKTYGMEPGRVDGAPKPMSVEQIMEWNGAGEGDAIVKHLAAPGLRLMTYLSQFIEPGQDPVKFVGRLIMESGEYETDPEDNDWFREGE